MGWGKRIGIFENDAWLLAKRTALKGLEFMDFCNNLLIDGLLRKIGLKLELV
jgi:hypothetical protein